MDENFDKCCEFVVHRLEGQISKDPNDPGGLTVWGLSKKYNPEVYEGMTYAQAKQIYRSKYWRSDCSRALWPLDLVFFDGHVNPQDDPQLDGSGNTELVKILGNWEDEPPFNYAYRFLIHRMGRYARRSKDEFVRGHVLRCERLLEFIEKYWKEDTKWQDL